MVRRHPHVFAGRSVDGAAEVAVNWEEIKAAEKSRASVLDGVPPSLPALARADKVLGRLERAGYELDAVPTGENRSASEEQIGAGFWPRWPQPVPLAWTPKARSVVRCASSRRRYAPLSEVPGPRGYGQACRTDEPARAV
jgi:hypothetical protein